MKWKKSFFLFCVFLLFAVTVCAQPKEITDNTKRIINNGSLFVQYGENTYYREYTAESYDEGALFANYEYKPEIKKNMMCLNADGSKEIVFEDIGVGNIYVSNEKMFLQGIDVSGRTYIYSVDLDEKNKKIFSEGKIEAIDEKNNLLICMRGDAIYNDTVLEMFTIDTLNEQQKIIKNNVRFEALDEDTIYYSDYEKIEGIKLHSISTNGSNDKILMKFNMSNIFEYYNKYDFYGFQQFEFLEDRILCSIGGFAGTGNIY